MTDSAPGALATDFYELTMLAGYVRAGMNERCTFELFVRELPQERGFLVAAGLEQALAYLEGLHFTPDEIAWLRVAPGLSGAPRALFDEILPAFRFTGDVWAVREGEPVFAREPLVRITAPLQEAQLVETALLAIINFQTSIASKAARVVHAARGRSVAEFGTRRAHGLEAGMFAARAAFIAGCTSTSNTEAGHRFGVPVSGTMAHSWVMAFDDERAAFRAYLDTFGPHATLLLDTYDTVRAAERIVDAGLRPAFVRLDSGDLAALSRRVRAVLDRGGLSDTRIIASGDLDEYRITDLIESGACVDLFGVGTALSTSRDAPALGGVYKLVEIERGGRARPVVKLSGDKETYPGAKQVWRTERNAMAVDDVIALATDSGCPGRPLLECVMRQGRRTGAAPALGDVQALCRSRVSALPEAVRRLRDPKPLQVRIASSVRALRDQAVSQVDREKGGRERF